jgi:predicted RecB family endonuclease
MPLVYPDDRLQPGSEKLAEQVGDQAVKDIVKDLRLGPASFAPTPPPVARGNGWYEPRPTTTWSPPGLKYMDAMVDRLDQQDRAARVAERLAELSQRIDALEATHAAEVEALKAENARLRSEAGKVYAARRGKAKPK